MPAVSVEGLVVRYGSITAVDGLSFAADRGEVVALLGPNGAGKTTAVETLEGFRRAHAGRVRVLDLDPFGHRSELMARLGVMPQVGGVYPGIRPPEMLRLYAALFDDAEDPGAMLERVGLTHRARSTWRDLSGGEQQRLSLALALIGKPAVAVLDEPTAGVDVSGRQVIRQIINDLRSSGVCVLLTTHELDEAERIADRVVIIDRGRAVATGTPAELMAAGGSNEIRFGAPAGLDKAALGKVMVAPVDELSPGEYRIDTPPTPANVAALTAWLAERDLPLADLRAGRQRLEDVFLRLTAITGEHRAVPGDVALAEDPQPAKGRSRRARRRERRGPGRR